MNREAGGRQVVTSESRVGQMFGQYKIVGMLGKGGMGEVYEAQDTSKGRTVALKILSGQFSHDESFRMRFQRESRAAAILQEPHVIPIHDWGEIDGNLYIDMRLVRGSTMLDLLENGPIEPARAVELVSQVASALDAAHAAGLIHRDIKPQNIIVTDNDFSYLVDFGIAEAQGDAGLTMTGTYVGTVSYMAPERFSGEGGATSAVDVYSLACVLYECLTGATPFPTKPGMMGIEQAMVGHLSTPPPSPSMANHRVPPAFDAVIARGMAKEPDDRYGSAGALARAAKRALEGGPPVSGPGVATMQGYGTPTVNAPPAPDPYTMGSAPHTMAADPYAMGSGQHTMRAPTGPQPAHYAAPPVAPYPGQYSPPTQYGPPPGQYSPPPQYSEHSPPPAAPPSAAAAPAQRSWLLPTVIAVSAVLIVASIGVVLFTQTSDEDKGSGTASQQSTLTAVNTPGQTQPQSSAATTPAPPAGPPPSGTPPPLVAGNDATGQSCYSFGQQGQTGFGSQSGRGSSDTSCTFAASVLTAYWTQFGRPAADTRVVSAAGAVSCTSVVVTSGPGCQGSNFLVQCQEFAGQNFVTCTGGHNARVYIW
jgi:serine/threonine kinase PknH